MRRLGLVLLVLLLAACGGSGRLSKQAYEQQLRAAGRQAQAATQRVADPSAPRLARARAQLQAVVDRLETLKPPRDAEADTKQIGATLQFLADEIGKLRRAVQVGDRAAAAAVSAEIQRSKVIAAGQRAATDLQQKGYDVGVFGR